MLPGNPQEDWYPSSFNKLLETLFNSFWILNYALGNDANSILLVLGLNTSL